MQPLTSIKQNNPIFSPLKGNVNHSVARWSFGFILEELLAILNDLGVKGIDLIDPNEWPTLKKYGIECSMCSGAAINLEDGFNNPKFHEELVKRYTEMIPKVADAGYTNLICFSGNRRGE